MHNLNTLFAYANCAIHTIQVPNGTYKQILTGAMHRIGVWIIPDGSAAINLSWDATVGGTAGALTPSAGPMYFSIKDSGNLCTLPLFAAGIGAAANLTIVEIFPTPGCGCNVQQPPA